MVWCNIRSSRRRRWSWNLRVAIRSGPPARYICDTVPLVASGFERRSPQGIEVRVLAEVTIPRAESKDSPVRQVARAVAIEAGQPCKEDVSRIHSSSFSSGGMR